MIEDDDGDEEIEENGYINYAQHVPREKLEDLANVFLGPLIENRELFDYHDLSRDNAVKILDFSNIWLSDICQTATESEFFRHLSIPDEIILPGCTDSAKRFAHKFDSLSEAEQKKIHIFKNELDQADDIRSEKQTLAMQKHTEATTQIREELFKDTFNQDWNASLHLDDYIITTADECRILDKRKSADEAFEDETRQIVVQYQDACQDLMNKMEAIMGFDPSDYFFGDPCLKLIKELGISHRIKQGIELLGSVLSDLARGQRNVFTEGLNQYRGRPVDATVVKQLKDRIGVTYRALRKIGASQTEAVDAINDALKEDGIPIIMEPDAIRKRAPDDLSLPKWQIPIFFDQYISSNGELNLSPGETRADKLKDATVWWLLPYMQAAHRFFGK